jgi:hypothetical protein
MKTRYILPSQLECKRAIPPRLEEWSGKTPLFLFAYCRPDTIVKVREVPTRENGTKTMLPRPDSSSRIPLVSCNTNARQPCSLAILMPIAALRATFHSWCGKINRAGIHTFQIRHREYGLSRGNGSGVDEWDLLITTESLRKLLWAGKTVERTCSHAFQTRHRNSRSSRRNNSSVDKWDVRITRFQ